MGYFANAIVVARDCARADIRIAANGRIADVAQVRRLRAFVHDVISSSPRNSQRARLREYPSPDADAKTGQSSPSRPHAARIQNGVRADHCVIIHASIEQHAAGLDFATRADARVAEKLHARFDHRVRARQ